MSKRKRLLTWFLVTLILSSMLLQSLVSAAVPAPAAADPTSVAVVGSLQSELGCPGDWQPECTATYLAYDAGDDVWQGTFTVPAGAWEYKAALNNSWDENYGAGAAPSGPNIALNLVTEAPVKFFYDHKSHWITDNQNAVIATVPGSYQSELGCAGDWDPSCLRSWLQDPDGDGIYRLTAGALAAGSYEAKVALNESWDVNYGANGEPGGANIPFTVPAGATVNFAYDSTSHVLTITVLTGGLEPGDELLVRPVVRTDFSDNIFYFLLPDRFANGDPANDTGGDASGDPLVNGFLPTDKGYYHGGDLAGLMGKLDYLQGLGVTAIWMTPQFTNDWIQGDGTAGGSSAAYHGYWQVDFTRIDPHFGTNQEMVDLIAAAHARDIKVFFDIVANATGDVISYEGGTYSYRSKDDYPYRDADGNAFDDRDYAGTATFPALDAATSFPYKPIFLKPADETAKTPAWLNNPIYYHNRGNSTFAGENSLYGDFYGLDDLFTEHPDVVNGMIDIHKAIISTFKPDGFRVDTVKHVNDEFWAAFVPATQAHAQAEGIADFTLFGEVYSGDASYTGRYTTELPFPSVLDFEFDGYAKTFAAGGTQTDSLYYLFTDGDYYTDADSNAYALVKFIGNHDIGRLGHEIDVGNPGAADAERVARSKLGYGLMFFSRGVPLIYYGDEQGFTGDGGDKDARQDMMPSQVASYNDDDLIGTTATTADANFDMTHPLYQAFSEFAAVRQANPALRQGAQIHRYSEPNAGIYAFARIDREERIEYIVALNNSELDDSATFPVVSPATTFTEIYPGGGPGLVVAEGNLTVDVPALDLVIYRANAPVPASAAAPDISMTLPAAGAEVTGQVEVHAEVQPAEPAEVTFAVSVGGGKYQVLGTDDDAPYRVFYDSSKLAVGTALTFKAIVDDLAGHLNAAKVAVVVGEEAPPVTGQPYAVIHYARADGEYGDHTTGDYNDYWGLHLWGDIEETIEWTAPKPFLGADEYGRFAWVKLAATSSNVGFIVHRGDTKDGTTADRFFNPAQTPEIWLKNDDANTYTSQAAAQGFVTIHYHRPDGDYGDPTGTDYWGLHLWGDAIDPSEGTSWGTPKKPTGVDDYGAYWKILIANAKQPLNFIIHRGDNKDPGPDESFIPEEMATVWKISGDLAIYSQQGAAQGFATLHYHRDAGDYGDTTSSDYRDFWGLHTWSGADDPGWTTPRKPAAFDIFGAVFEVPLQEGATQFGYLLHRGDEKDPGPDQYLVLDKYGYEVWQLQAADLENPYLLPILGEPGANPGNIAEQRAYWVSEDTIAWAAAESSANAHKLCYAPAGGLEATDNGVTGGECLALTLDPAGLAAGVKEKFPHLADLPALKIAAADLALVPEILKGQIAVSAVNADGKSVNATGLQIPGVLDDLYTYDGPLGVSWTSGSQRHLPTVRLWAPTARSVTLHLFADSNPATTSTTLPMTPDPATGVWSITGERDWQYRYYLFEVEVYVHSTGRVEHNVVTDPYSFSLALNSTRSQMVDLKQAELKPAGWNGLEKPDLAAPEDISIYELHIRDFSVNDPSLPDELKGTYKAFTQAGTYGTNHLRTLQAAGLTHVHLLPAFDIATINEDQSQWQAPDPAVLATYASDSSEQQAAVTQYENLDGFNWGYDPWHYTVPEGSYSTVPDGYIRIIEFREMVQALNEMGLRVVMDVVYNHTNSAGQGAKSVLDRVVPGYYHRLDERGQVTTSTCCPNTATEHNMMEKLMVDSLVTWATQYKIDAFRFDLMGHHMVRNMVKVREALDALTMDEDGVDGKAVYIYGEGWNFGEVADNARGENATQLNLAGTGIGTFSDRLRDAVRGGGPFDTGETMIRRQGFANGLYYDPNELNAVPEPAPEPAAVGIPGSLQSELGCPGDWQPECAATRLTYDAADRVWQGTFTVPAGSWEYKAALNNSWDENYGAGAERNGPNIALNLAADTSVKFYYDHQTHWIVDNQNATIATVPGSYQSALGCPGDWQPDCLRSWLQDPDGDGTYTFASGTIPPGSYEAKVALNESWDVNYGAGGVQNGPNIAFTVEAGQTVLFSYDAVSHVLAISFLPSDQLASLLLAADQIRVGMAGNLADYEFVDRTGTLVTGKDVDYNGQPAGYTQDPQENITYISKHDNQTLYDNNTYKTPVETSMADRVRLETVGLSTVMLGQGVPFIQAGTELLRSKSLDRDSYNSGDWFNKLDLTLQSNNFGVGLPPAGKNQSDWPVMQPLLANPNLQPKPADIKRMKELYLELLRIRKSSALFHLETAEQIQERLKFYNTGPEQLPGLIVMSLSDEVEPDLDDMYELIVVLINANDEAQTITIPELANKELLLHLVQVMSVDDVVKTSRYHDDGTFKVPARTTAVFVAEMPAQQQLRYYLLSMLQEMFGPDHPDLALGRALMDKVEQAIGYLNEGRPKDALNMLNAFKNQVWGLMHTDVLNADEGQALLDRVDAIIHQIRVRYGMKAAIDVGPLPW